MLLGFKRHSGRRDPIMYSNVTVHTIRRNFEATLQNIDMDHMVIRILYFITDKDRIIPNWT